jgi:hypothetical protein
VKRVRGEDDPIASYAQAQPPVFRPICDRLRELIEAVNLLFWNGQAFDEDALQPVGKYRAAHALFSDAAEVDPKVIRRWLKKAKADVFDSKAFFKKLREGK